MLFFILLIPSIVLSQSYKLEDIIFVDKFEKNKEDLVQNLYVIDQDEIKRHQRLEDLLQTIPGFSIKRSSGVSNFTYRGLPSRYSLILIDGQRISDLSSIDNSFNLNSLSILNVQKIEVLTGAQSVMYGTGASVGVVNIVTKKNENNLSVLKGNRFASHFNLNQVRDNQSIVLNGFFEENTSLSSKQNGEEKDTSRLKGGQIKFDKEIGNSLFSVAFNTSSSFNEIDGYLNSQFSDLSGLQTHNELNQIVFEYKRKKIKMTSAYSFYQRQTDDLQLNELTHSSFKSYDLLNLVEYKLYPSTIFGLSHNYQKAVFNEKKEQNILSAFVVSEKKVSELSLSLGLRYDKLTKNKDVLTYSAGALSFFDIYHSLRANYSVGFRQASFYQKHDTQYGNGKLDAEGSETIEVSYGFKNIYNLTIFKNKIVNAIDFDTRYYNSKTIQSEGLESYFENLYLKYNYRLGFVILNNIPSKGGSILKSIPKEQYYLTFNREFENVAFDTRFDYFSERFDGDEYLSPYSLISFGISKKIKNWMFNFRIFNLLNQSYQESYDFSRPTRNFEFMGRLNF